MRIIKHRQSAQITPFALLALLVLSGALALVVDAGVFFVTQRQMQTAADAAALAAVWYADNACGFGVANGCDPTPKPPTCNQPNYHESDCVADEFALVNMGFTGRLCSSVNINPPTVATGRTIHFLGGPPLNYYRMQIDCDAPYWFARVFPRFGATFHITAVSVATVGFQDTNRNVTGVPGTLPLITRLAF